jgi:hypothetical protein
MHQGMPKGPMVCVLHPRSLPEAFDTCIGISLKRASAHRTVFDSCFRAFDAVLLSAAVSFLDAYSASPASHALRVCRIRIGFREAGLTIHVALSETHWVLRSAEHSKKLVAASDADDVRIALHCHR